MQGGGILSLGASSRGNTAALFPYDKKKQRRQTFVKLPPETANEEARRNGVTKVISVRGEDVTATRLQNRARAARSARSILASGKKPPGSAPRNVQFGDTMGKHIAVTRTYQPEGRPERLRLDAIVPAVLGTRQQSKKPTKLEGIVKHSGFTPPLTPKTWRLNARTPDPFPEEASASSRPEEIDDASSSWAFAAIKEAKRAEHTMISRSMDNVRAELLAERLRAKHVIQQSRVALAARNRHRNFPTAGPHTQLETSALLRARAQRERERREEEGRELALRRQGEALHSQAARQNTLALQQAKTKQAAERREMKRVGAGIIGATEEARGAYFQMLRGNLNIQPLHRASA